METKIGNKKYMLIFYSIILVCAMYICFILFRFCNNKIIEYFGPYCIYLFLLFIGYIIFGRNKIIKVEMKNKYIDYIFAFIPVIATFFIAFLPTISHIGICLFLITIIYSIFNGILEELFWRYTFNYVYIDNILMAYIIPTIIFTCWHFALLLCKGMSYNGGALALVGGAGFMGVIWGYVMFHTKNIKITIMAHVLVNICAFSQLLYCNF